MQGSVRQIMVSAQTDVGLIRQHQEDDYLVAADFARGYWERPLLYQGSPGSLGSLFVVADGMGGMNAGEVASSLAVEGMQSYFDRLLREGEIKLENAGELLLAAFPEANQLIRESATEDQVGMGTTMVVAWLVGEACHVAWVGDSRCYLYRPGKGTFPLTKDHSYVQSLVDKRKISEEDAFYHPKKNVITQSLGGPDSSIAPDLLTSPVAAGDRLLLCSDGLNSMLRDEQIDEILSEGTSCQECASTLIAEAKRTGGHDNITVIVVDCLSEAQAPVLETPLPAFSWEPPATPFAGQPQANSPPPSYRRILVWLTFPLLLVGVTILVLEFSNPSAEPHDNIGEAPVDTSTLENDSAQDTLPPASNWQIIFNHTKEDRAEKKKVKLNERYPHHKISVQPLNNIFQITIDGFPSQDSAINFMTMDTINIKKDARIIEVSDE